jgi:hypothetical protein
MKTFSTGHSPLRAPGANRRQHRSNYAGEFADLHPTLTAFVLYSPAELPRRIARRAETGLGSVI